MRMTPMPAIQHDINTRPNWRRYIRTGENWLNTGARIFQTARFSRGLGASFVPHLHRAADYDRKPDRHVSGCGQA